MRTARLIPLLWLALAGACADDLCLSSEPAFQVDLTLASGVDASRIEQLIADVSAAGQRKVAALQVGPLRANRAASFDVFVGPAGAGGFTADVRVEARGKGGAVLARANVRFSGSGDACNIIDMVLAAPSTPDAGPPVDLPPAPDGPVRPKPDLRPRPDQPWPDTASPFCLKDGASCMGGMGTCYKGKCCTGCWDKGFIGVTCQPGTSGLLCGRGGSICAACPPLSICKSGICVPMLP